MPLLRIRPTPYTAACRISFVSSSHMGSNFLCGGERAGEGFGYIPAEQTAHAFFLGSEPHKSPPVHLQGEHSAILGPRAEAFQFQGIVVHPVVTWNCGHSSFKVRLL